MNETNDVADATQPTREEMIAFLRGHFRYYTMNSWNRSTSYARRVKIHNLGLTGEQESRAYDLIYVEDTFLEINEKIGEFSEENGYRYQACFNGSSSGYIVMLQGGKEPSGYQSYCSECGQMNYKKVLPIAETPEDKVRNYIRVKNWWVPDVYIQQEDIIKHGLTTERVLEIIKEVRAEKAEYSGDAACGKCGALARKNFATPHQRIYTKGIGTDEDADFENEDEWDLGYIKDRYDLVKSFDKMVDDCIEIFKSVCDNYRVVEMEVPCTRKVKILEPIAAEA
ncbi:MAG: hypothetical protein Q7J35_11695 [Candidatus Methanoperedens sp.]|nr:hypothetical protein [Candidatus Methanoperedens sp.]